MNRLTLVVCLGGLVLVIACLIAASAPDSSVGPTATAVAFVAACGLTVGGAFYAYLHPRSAPLAPAVDGIRRVPAQLLLIEFGKIARFAFFAVTAGQVWVFTAAADWSVFDTPFAAMTLGLLIGGLTKLALVVSISVLWFWWAFASGEREYEGWGYFGLTAALVGVVAALRLW